LDNLDLMISVNSDIIRCMGYLCSICCCVVSAILVKSDPTNGGDKFSLIECVDLIMRFFILNLVSSPNRLRFV
jgi:hypothetical protein